MVVVFSEENAREYLHEDDDGDEARCAQNFPHWGLGDGEEVSEAFFRPLAGRRAGGLARTRYSWRDSLHPLYGTRISSDPGRAKQK